MNEVFHMVPATIRWGMTLALLIPLVLVVVVIGGVTYSMLSGAKNSTFELSSAGLRLRGDFYGRLIPASELRPAEAVLVNLDASPYHPTLRLNGIAVPGYRDGWFRLRNGRKALLYVTDPTKVVVVPTTAGYDVLLSVIDPSRFLDRLHTVAGPAPATALP